MAETVAEGPSHRTTRNLCWGVSQRGRALWAQWEDTRTAIWQESAQYFFPISCKSKRKTIGIWKHLFKSLGTLSNVPLSLGVRRCWNLLLARDRKQTKKRQTMRKCTKLLLHSIPSKECKQANSTSQEKNPPGTFPSEGLVFLLGEEMQLHSSLVALLCGMEYKCSSHL